MSDEIEIDDDRDESDEDGDCSRCGGEGWTDCDDPIQCMSRHNSLGECPCSACGGSGNARDQTVW